MQVDRSEKVVVQIPNSSLNSRPGIVIATRGKLVGDLRGLGPGGAVVLARAGSPVLLSPFDSQRRTKITLGRVYGQGNQEIDFQNTSKEFASETLPHDGTPLRVSFDVAASAPKKMLLADFEKQKIAMPAGSTSQLSDHPSGTYAGTGERRSPGLSLQNGQHRRLTAGTMLPLQFNDAITVSQVTQGKLFPANVTVTRSSTIFARGRETLPEGTTVFVRVTQADGRRYLLEVDHAVLQGSDIPLTTNSTTLLPRGSSRGATVPLSKVGPYRLPDLQTGSGDMVLLPAQTVISLTTRSDAALDAGQQR